MPLQFPCSNAECGKTLTCSEDSAGKRMKCPGCGSISRAPKSGDDEPRELGEYTIVRKLGEGGMGAVYEAVQKGLERHVALKVLSERLLDDPTYLQRFQREARAAAAFDHPNIVQVFQIGEQGGKHFFSMQFVEGESLQDRLKREGNLSVSDAIEIVSKVADALDYAWKHGEMIHRDIKPDNILLTKEGQVKVADLGLAKSVQEETRVTTTGVSMGTPAYMAPEQGEDARDVDCRADIYSLGITLYHTIVGRLPFEKRTALSMMMAHVDEPLPDPRDHDPGIPDGVSRVLKKMCAKDPQDRHQTPEELLTDLKTARVDSTLRSRKARPAAAKPMQERPTELAAPTVREAPTIPDPRRRKREVNRRPVLPFVLAAAVAVLVVGFLVMNRGKPGPLPDPGPGSKAAPPAQGQTGSAQKVSLQLQPWNELARAGFQIPEGTEDQYGNQVRTGRDQETGLPLEIRHKQTGMHLVFIPAGEFMMGDRRKGDGRKVRLTKPFYAGKYEVTQAEWKTVMGDNPSQFPDDRNPVERASWHHCQAFIAKLQPRATDSGLGFALPTEAQWEYACRAGTETRFSFGDDLKHGELPNFAWLKANSGGRTHPVGGKRPNAWGLFDMHGNVGEWCQDRHGPSQTSEVTDPSGPLSGKYRVRRGGNWQADGKSCRSAHRYRKDPGHGNGTLGCRVALNIPQTSPAGAAAGSGKLPAALVHTFDVPTEPKDQHGNPIRAGRDEKTGLPLEIRHKQTGMHLVFVPAGEFMMGSPRDEKGWTERREGRQHKVKLTKPFYLGKYEVTQSEWEKVTGENPSEFKAERNPVETVSWPDCVEFMKKLNAQFPVPNSQFRLPTEAQWEYACRAGTQTRFFYGDDVNEEDLKEYAWYKASSGNRTHPVGEKKANAWGMYDMQGNVWEWCQDWHSAYPGGEVSDPMGPGRGKVRVLRGGTWHHEGHTCRSAYRHDALPSTAYDGLGCRVALSIPLTLARPAAAGDKLPHPLGQAFEIPTEAKDQHGNPIRLGTDKATGLPLEIRHKQTGMHLVFIPAGEFMMGSPEGEKGRDSGREGAQHKVRLTKPFYLGKYEVTQAEWQKVTGANPSRFQGTRNPVERVTWPECVEFMRKLNTSLPSVRRTTERGVGGEGFSFALPTEAQWEYACRAGAQTRFSHGDDVKEDHLKDYCWYRVNSGGQTHGVGEKKPTRWGLYDMHGNVWEWCQDWYGPYPGGEASDPSGPEGGEYRVNRGGAWKFDGYNCRTAYRGAGRPSNRIDIFGCRVALNIPLTWTQRAAARAELPHALGHAFEIPTEAKDQHGNPIRQGTDKATGLPLEIRHKQTGMHLVFITPGEFLMGSPEGERGRDAEREGTRHKVQLTKPFYLGKYEVTQAEWRRVMPTNPSTFRGERNPVEQVTWPECADFIIRLNERVAARYRRETAGERTHTRSIEGLQAGTSLCYAGLLPEGPILLSAA